MNILNKIAAALYALEFIFSVFLTVVSMFITRKRHRKIRRIWARCQRFFLRYKIEVINAPDPRANLLILNHQSILDIVALEEIHPGDLCWLAKKEIADIPILGGIISLPKMISVDRKDKKSLIKIVKDIEDRIQDNRIITIFPEGTRGDGKTLLEFKGGVKLIVSKLNLKVQPVLVIGSREILDSKKFSVKRGNLKIIYMDLVDTSKKDWLETSKEAMQEILTQNINSQKEEPGN